MRQDHEPSSGYLWLKTKGASVSLTSQWGGAITVLTLGGYWENDAFKSRSLALGARSG